MRDDPRADRARELFEQAFHARAEGVAFAPGRVNLIGEHTDYNDGFVLPMAIDRGVTIAMRSRSDRTLRARSTLTGDTQSVDLDALEAGHRGWMAYVAGVAWALVETGHTVRGADLLIHSDLPTGAGLSSSAALEVATALALGAANDNCTAVAKVARRAENDFVGVACGVMDQMASACAKAGGAMLLDCRSLETTSIQIPDRASIVVIDTGVRRRLAGSEYNERRAACARVVTILRAEDSAVRALRDVTLDRLRAARARLGAGDYHRALHVVGENQRVLSAVDALSRADMPRFGALLNESHESLRDLYGVSSAELNAAVDCARDHPACYGARMTGAGFGGCAVAAVDPARAAGFVDLVRAELHTRLGPAADAFVCRPAGGATRRE